MFLIVIILSCVMFMVSSQFMVGYNTHKVTHEWMLKAIVCTESDDKADEAKCINANLDCGISSYISHTIPNGFSFRHSTMQYSWRVC